jgi:uncharacterized protein
MGCCDSSTQLGSDRGIFGVGAGVVESDAAARRRAEASGAEAPDIATRFTAGRAEATSAAEQVAEKAKKRASGAKAPDHKLGIMSELKLRPPKKPSFSASCEAAATAALSVAGNSVGARNVLEIDDLRTMNSPTKRQGSAAKWLLLLFVRFYQIFFSPFLGGACKFYPSCSRYAQEAIEMHGARRGAWLAMKRLGRCRPFTKGGFDPVPDVMHWQESAGELGSTNADCDGGTSAAKAAACLGERYVVAEATTHKAAIQNATTKKRTFYYSDADWLRTMGKERAQ